jgi:type III secretory pathway component EscV
LAPLDWAVRVGERTDTGTAAPADGDAAAGLTAPLIAALRPAAPLFVSRQIVRHLLDQTKKSHPAVVKAARALVGEAQIAAAMVMELREGRSVRNLPMLLEDLVRRNSDQR